MNFLKSAVPHVLATSNPSSVRALPQLSHSILRPAPKRTRSEAVRTCFVDIRHRYSDENDSGTLNPRGQVDSHAGLASSVCSVGFGGDAEDPGERWR
jgi:hypothetical protein